MIGRGRNPSEHAEQSAFIEWFVRQYPRVLIYAIPNGAHLAGDQAQRAAQMNRLRKEGFIPGMPDLHVPEWRLWIEMKCLTGVLRVSQRAIHMRLEGIGDTVIVTMGCDHAIRAVREFRA